MSQTLSDRQLHTTDDVGLPVSWYFDPEILEIERQSLFAAGPTYSGHKSLLKANGDYFTLGGLQTGKLLVQNNGRPHLVSNVCRHCQSQIMTGAGHAKNIVCPLHNWAYELDGCQVAAPHFEKNPCLDLERIGHPVQGLMVRTVHFFKTMFRRCRIAEGLHV